MKRCNLLTAILCLMAFVALPSKATLVTEWGFDINSGFTSYDPLGSVDGSNTNTFWNAPSTLTWGTSTGSGRSSLDVNGAGDGLFSGSLFTNGAAVDTVTLTHTNNTITGTGLSSAVLSDHIFLTPLDPVGPGFAPPALIFDILFIETPNSGTCAATSPTPCNDIFVLDVAGAGFNPINNTLNQNFNYGGEAYNARLFIDGLGVLEDDACLAASAAIGCIGFTTVENQVNTFDVALDITTRQFNVPEPGTFLIFAIGLMSLVVARKR